MTRKKWNRLRRQRPELFGMLPPFEKWNDYEREIMRSVSKRRALSVMTAWLLETGPHPFVYFEMDLEPLYTVGAIRDKFDKPASP